MVEENRLTQYQQYLLDKVNRTSRRRASTTRRKAHFTATQQNGLERAREKLGGARLVMNRNLRQMSILQPLIENLLRIPRFYSRMEIGDFPDGARDQNLRTRIMVEFKLYGATPDLQVVFSHMLDAERPLYASLDYIDAPQSLAPLRHWGWHRFRLRNEVKERCTFTPSDSFFAEREQVFLWKDIDGVLAQRAAGGRYWFEYINSALEPFSMVEGVGYIEAQILGGVTLADVDRLYYPEAEHLDMEFFSSLERLRDEYGIELIAY